MSSSITVIIAVYNIWRRAIHGHDEGDAMRRVYYSLLSIANADDPPQVIIADGSTRMNYNRLHEYAEQFPNVRHVHLPQPAMNLSRLWNQGIILSKTNLFLVTGTDFLYAPTYWDKLREMYRPGVDGLPGNMVISEVLMCPKLWVPNEADINGWKMPEAKPNGAGAAANGVQLFDKAWAAMGGGFDEAYLQWGAMDNDHVKRAKIAGVPTQWLRDKQVYHIWHPTEKTKTRQAVTNFNKNQVRLRNVRGFQASQTSIPKDF